MPLYGMRASVPYFTDKDGGVRLKFSLLGEERCALSASVRDLCGFLLRSGSIGEGAVTNDILLAGTLAHRRFQKARKETYPDYLPERRVKVTQSFGCCDYTIGGILDGVYISGGEPCIDEFKTTPEDPAMLDWGSAPAYEGQVMCYGYLYLRELRESGSEAPPEGATLCLSYHNLDSGTSRELTRRFDYAELERFFIGLLEAYERWARLRMAYITARNPSIDTLAFPFGQYRKGQRELAAAVYRVMRDNNRLFAEAPTGIGKTMSVLFPAIKALGGGLTEKLFYLTPKTVTGIAAADALSLMRSKGLRLKSIMLTSREKLCEYGEKCNAEDCPNADGHDDRVNDALYDLLTTSDALDADVILAVSRQHRVCPFELSLDASEFCDCVVCDYNYAFDPRAQLQRYFVEGGSYTLLIDEAHNLPERGREMFSASLDRDKIVSAYKPLRTAEPKLLPPLRRAASVMKKLSDEMLSAGEKERVLDIDKSFLKQLDKFCELYGEFLAAKGHDETKNETIELFFDALFLLKTCEYAEKFPESYAAHAQKLTHKAITFNQLCVNPAPLITLTTDKVASSVFFSATLSPFDYYTEMLGGSDEDKRLRLGSPFPRKNLLVGVYGGLSSRYNRREESIVPAAELIYSACSRKNGNYMAFLPSYAYMKSVYEVFSERHPEVRTAIQRRGMDGSERETFLSAFKDYGSAVFVAFAVCGGMFSEGVDLTGDQLSGTVIIGTGLPQVCFERGLIRSRFDASRGHGVGFDYAYTFPGLNKVFQAGGRVIRTASDRGFILLADDRFLRPGHSLRFPESWQSFRIFRTPEAAADAVGAFWGDEEMIENN